MESISRDWAIWFEHKVLLRYSYTLPDIYDLLRKSIIFHIVGDDQLQMGVLDAEPGEVESPFDREPNGTPENLRDKVEQERYFRSINRPSSYFSRIEQERVSRKSSEWIYVFPVLNHEGDEDLRVNSPLSFDEWEMCLRERGIVTDADTSWLERAVIRAGIYIDNVFCDKLGGLIQQTLRESVFHSLDDLMSEDQLNNLLRLTRSCDSYSGIRSGKRPERNSFFDLGRLSQYYEELRSIWQDAKEDYNDYKNHPVKKKKWFALIKTGYEDYKLPNDLIARLADPDDPYLPDDLVESIPRKVWDSGISKPSYLAIEHAARLCGSPPYSVPSSTLFEILRRQKSTDDRVDE